MEWSPKLKDLGYSEFKLLKNTKLDELKTYTLQDILDNSEKFPINFPVDAVRLKSLKNKKNVTKDFLTKSINSVYPFMHESALQLCIQFIELKQNYGSSVEQKFYKNMQLKSFINRLLKNRAVMFMGKADYYILLSGERGARKWEFCGTAREFPPLILENCLSYDEIKLSALLYVSSYTHFINKGERKNRAVYADDRSLIQDDGIIMGMIGPRLKKFFVMDFQEIVLTPKQNIDGCGTNEPSIQKLFCEFYQEYSYNYETAQERMSKNTFPGRYVKLPFPKGAIFDNEIYKKRLTIVFDTMLVEANYRAQQCGKMAYLHVVGLGLGVWKISSHQEKIYVNWFYQRLQNLSSKLQNISDVCFSYFGDCAGLENGSLIKIDRHPLGGIYIHIYRRQPHEKLDDPDKLLVVSYAWDGNALPGNEWWDNKLDKSGDSAAASSTQITELHNPHINPLVCADNLRIVTSEGHIETFKSFIEQMTRKESEAPGN
ncbi:uncharacterized protein LOC126736463 isoform X2 [Anthonomus grandis grandis]|uniref:uncharacterized protein LOC126736463 isoform X2 n=1 Tax=Anthonomus grandis grandis TaxID=2921223 RepID=UPI0021654452|nr:uncharacterized protein LOC126736463 isoform X2 [Anthonomus grandis grandis]